MVNPHQTPTPPSNIHHINSVNPENSKDFQDIQTYINFLTNDKNAPVHWQFFIDDKKMPTEEKLAHAQHIVSPLATIYPNILTRQKTHAGVYITVNETDGIGRRKTNIKQLRAVFVDGDNTPLPTEFPITPHLITGRSNQHWHAYWKIDPTMTRTQWYEVQSILATYLGTDTAVVDSARVLRVPGTYNHKDINNIQRHNIINILPPEQITPITYEQFIEHFKLTPEQQTLSKNLTHTREEFVNTATALQTPDDQIPTVSNALAQINAMPPGVQGINGNHLLFAAFAKCYELGLSREMAYKTVTSSTWLLRTCQPAWNPKMPEDQGIIIQTLNNVYVKGYAQAKFGQQNIKSIMLPITSVDGELNEIKFQLTKEGKIKKNFSNACRMFNPALGTQDLVYFNEFTNDLMLAPNRAISWSTYHAEDGTTRNEITTSRSRSWTDADSLGFKKLICDRVQELDFGKDTLTDAAICVARENMINPPKRYFESLVWDKQPRLNRFFSTYGGAEDNLHNSYAAQHLIKAMVARLFFPGCKVDYTIIIEGEQGTGKSSALKLLGGKYYGQMKLNLNNEKDLLMAARQHLLIEIPEFATSYTELDHQKAFLTITEDTYRPSYGRTTSIVPRSFTFVITINPKDNYLKDPTGNRRFIPVVSTKWDLQALERDVEQIHAEAYHRVIIQKEKWYEEDRDSPFYKLATEEQDKRKDTDEWVNEISHWWAKNEHVILSQQQIVTATDIWRLALDKSGGKQNLSRQDTHRINNILQNEFKWKRGNFHDNKRNRLSVRGFKPKDKDIEDLF